ncbi:MAG: NYN domain-containing protein [Rhodocyclaceae bacterium]|nr:NYN domain-containing protein [Rhodocyclaceae bacterium]
MAASPEHVSMAVFCDFENVALGVRDAKYEKFDIAPVLERLLLKGAIVVKKAYCDWDRYKGFKATMHEANFELIEIPHVRQSGKNSADIRLVVDALDLCYTKSHVDTFVIVSGDSDFSPLVSKLRENAKQVIGVGVKQSTSDLLIANCDEFIFYDDLVRENQRKGVRREHTAQQRLQPEQLEARRSRAIEMAVETLDALVSERSDSGKIWASVLKEAIKRRKPDFNESYFGFKAFGNLLEEAQSRGLLLVGRDEKSNTFVQHVTAGQGAEPIAPAIATPAPVARQPAPEAVVAAESPPGKPPAPDASGDGDGEAALPEEATTEPPPKPRSGRGRSRTAAGAGRSAKAPAEDGDGAADEPVAPLLDDATGETTAKEKPKATRRSRSTSKTPRASSKTAPTAATDTPQAPATQPDKSEAKATPRRSRRTTKTETKNETETETAGNE